MTTDAIPTGRRREQWRSRVGFVLATLGAAVGLGNVWRFAYVAGENGGGAFLLVYAICVIVIGMPLLIAELAIGRVAQRDGVRAFEQLGGGRVWGIVGWLGVAACVLILTYYAVIAGWVLRYLAAYAAGAVSAESNMASSGEFGAYIAEPVTPILWQAATIAIGAAIVAAGVERGIEAVSKFLLPLLGVMIVLLAGYGLALTGGGAGLAFLLQPDWQMLGRPRIYLAALGQAFFSIGLAMGVLVTYGGYIAHRDNLLVTAAIVAAADTAFAVLAGIAIFPAVFAFGLDPAQGATLAFVTLPKVFAVMPAGDIFGFAFFLLLATAAVTSIVSLIEVSVAVLIDRIGWSRRRSTLAVAVFALLAGIPSSLGYGEWDHVAPFGYPLLDAVDYLASSILLPLSGLAIAAFVGWRWSRHAALSAAELRDSGLGRGWWYAIRYLAPLAIGAILLGALSAWV